MKDIFSIRYYLYVAPTDFIRKLSKLHRMKTVAFSVKFWRDERCILVMENI